MTLTAPLHGAKVLDLATGTGDFAIAFARAIGVDGEVVATDFTPDMLRHAEKKIERYNISLAVADAMQLQFDDNSFDVCSIAFGIRNVDDPVVALREMKRVVKPGGKIVVLEFGQPSGCFGMFYRWYSNVVIPFLGGIITGERKAYKYLQISSVAFASGAQFIGMMNQAGVHVLAMKRLLFGAVCVYVGEK